MLNLGAKPILPKSLNSIQKAVQIYLYTPYYIISIDGGETETLGKAYIHIIASFNADYFYS